MRLLLTFVLLTLTVTSQTNTANQVGSDLIVLKFGWTGVANQKVDSGRCIEL